MALKNGTKLELVSEYLTTKTCSACGKKNNLEASKIHQCQCGLETGRDENAAKNILKVGRNNHINDDLPVYQKIKQNVKSLDNVSTDTLKVSNSIIPSRDRMFSSMRKLCKMEKNRNYLTKVRTATNLKYAEKLNLRDSQDDLKVNCVHSDIMHYCL